MKRKLTLPSFVALISMSLVGAIAGSLAWLSDKADIGTNSNIGGSSDGAYFAYGDGSSTDPYGIETARQLYNLAWLQYFGYFNNKIEEDEEHNKHLIPYYFEVNADIDMTGWVLPPIGTTQYPFIGNFTGKTLQGYDEETGNPVYETHTISNLVISNDYNQILDTNKVPGRIKQAGSVSNVNIVGMFGVVGDLNNTIPANVTFDTSLNSIRDFYLNGATITSTASNTLIGIVAGYVNGTLSNVGVQDSNINEKSWTDHAETPQTHNITAVSNLGTVGSKTFSNISDYGIVGYCEDAYKANLKSIKSDVYNTVVDKYDYTAQDEGDEAGWGGSIDMKTTYDGLRTVWDTYSGDTGRKYSYPSTRTYVEDIDGNVVSDTYGGTWTEYSPDDDYNYYSYSQYAGQGEETKSANYTFAHRADTNRYMYLYGKNSITVDDVLTSNKTTYPEIENCFFISYVDNEETTHYLTKSGNTSIADQTLPENATSWNVDASNHIYTLLNGTDYYYLTDNDSTLSLTTNVENAKVWTWDGTNNVFTRDGIDCDYYLFYDNGWTLKSLEKTYYTMSGGGNYLGSDMNGSFSFLTEDGVGARWYMNDTGLYQYYGGVQYYLGMVYQNSSYYFQYSANPTNYYHLNGSYLTVYVNGSTRYLWYDNGWYIGPTQHTITVTTGGGGNPSIYAINKDGSAPNFKLRTTTNNITEDYTFQTEDTYFPLRQQTNDTSTQVSGYTFSYTTGGKTYYMVFNIFASSGLSTTEDANKATIWVSNGDYYNPYGYSSYYLNYYNSTGIVRCSESTDYRFTYTGGTLRATRNNSNYYAYYNGTSWVATTTNRSMTRTSKSSTITTGIPNGKPKDTNTGYIIGGAQGGQSGSDMQGNIRVSQYFGVKSSYPTSLTGLSTSESGVSLDTIYTIKSDNNSSTVINDIDSYVKLRAAKESLERVLTKDTEWIYGLHFMQSDITYGKVYDAGGQVIGDNSVHVPYALVNGEEKTDYELPKNCIDFNLKEKGYINFIAGAYFGNANSYGTITSRNNCFFTIQEVQRNGNDEITLIRPIKAIYSDGVNSHSYIYEYSTYDNDSNSTTKRYSKPFKLENGAKKTFSGDDYEPYSSTANIETDGVNNYTKVFNIDWISTSATLQMSTERYGNNYYVKGAPYYFEIPMNIGEYAMGAPSFSGAQGAYLMYLDIGANAKKINRTSITEYWEELESISSYAVGVGFVVAAGSSAVSDKNSFCVTIKSSFNSVLAFDRTADGTATYTSTPASNQVVLEHRSYISVNPNEQGVSEEPDTSLPTVSTSTTYYRRLTYYDYNSNSDSINKIVITDKKVGNGNWTRVSLQKWKDYNVENNTGTLDDGTTANHVDVYQVSGKVGTKLDDEDVMDINTIAIDTTSNTTRIISFSVYYPTIGTITITCSIDYALKVSETVDDDTSFTYVDFNPDNGDGYNFTVVLTNTSGQSTDITGLCKVNAITATSGGITYAFTINGTGVDSIDDEIELNLTVGS